jgi:class 3 adenylate cyclase/predicted ATPase
MQSVAAWLASLGLAEYAERFAAQHIDLAVLRDLSEEDLKELGVSLGHRRRLLHAIAALRAAVPAAAERVERRQLTVMFCDLAGSTALSARLDPEDTREVIRAYQQACAAVVRAYDGFIAKFMGDGVIVYFGYPRAHEDDAERAVRAGLDMVAAIGRLETRAGAPLQARIGIATGPVVAGDVVGEGPAQEQAVVGETPNLAARLQDLAEPASVVVSAATRRLIGGLFMLRDLGPRELKGYDAPVRAWAVEGATPSDSRFEAVRAARLTSFVNRTAETAGLLELQRRAWQRAGQAVLLTGEAGIGKSRIAAWVADRLVAEPHTRLRYQCSPYHGNNALYPFIGQLEYASRFKPEDGTAKRLDKLEAMLAEWTPDVAAMAPLFASLLSIDSAGRYPPLGLSSGQQRRRILAALLDRFEALARREPVLLIFEDAHWSDATSLELLDRAIDRIRDLPVFAIITARPEFDATWSGRDNVGTIALGRLHPDHARAMIEPVTGGRALPFEVVEQIIAKTDGIPLFVEELTKAVLESGLLVEEGEGYGLAGPLPPLAIPATLQDSLRARLDRLDAVRDVAQVGAAIGRSFSHPMVAAVSGLAEVPLGAALARLIDAELLYQSGEAPDAVYTFKHALVQDAAYDSMLRSRRQVLHARIVQVIEVRFPELAESECDVLAEHCARADLAEKAIDYWLRAGQRSLRRSHMAEAVMQFRAALTALAARPESVERRRRELEGLTGLAQALIGAKGYGAPETMETWHRAHKLAAAVGDAQQRFAITYGLWVGQYAQGHVATTGPLAAECLRSAEAADDCVQLCVAHRMTGIAAYVTGDFVPAREHCHRAVDCYDPERHGALARQFGHDLLAAALSFEGLSLWPIGYPDQARRALDHVLEHAQGLEHAPSVAYTYWHAGILGSLMLGEDARVAEHAAALLALAARHGLGLWERWGLAADGWCRATKDAAAVEQIHEALQGVRKTGHRIYETTVLGFLGDAQAMAGDVDAGLASLDEGIALAEGTRQVYWLAELYRLKGELRLQRDDRRGAEAALRQAMSVAQRQEAPSFALRAGIVLARLLAADDRAVEGRALVEPLLRRFTEGFGTRDFRAARALLTEIGS